MYKVDPTAEIHTFDHTIDGSDKRVANRKEFTFHNYGIGAKVQ